MACLIHTLHIQPSEPGSRHGIWARRKVNRLEENPLVFKALAGVYKKFKREIIDMFKKKREKIDHDGYPIGWESNENFENE